MTVPYPSWLKDWEARLEFKRVVDILGQNATLLDQSLLADYASTYAEVLDLERLLKDEDRVLWGAKGGAYTNPLVNQIASAKGHLSNLRRDLFFTPKSRGEKKKTQTKAKSLLERINDV